MSFGLVVIVIIFTLLTETSQISDNKCSRLEPFVDRVQVTKVVTYTYLKRGFWKNKETLDYEVQYSYETRYFTRVVKECCTGYSLHEGVCTPICHGGCINGKCTAPERCTCNDGYVKLTEASRQKLKEKLNHMPLFHYDSIYKKLNEKGCIPHCDECTNGFCTAPNNCTCDLGYSKNNRGICEPICETPCNNGNCIEPNKCSCFSSYTFAPNSLFNCIPICDPLCEIKIKGSHCIRPDECVCPEGFTLSPNATKCVPVCNNCKNGDCIAPDQCVCWEGYEKAGNGTCLPICHEECVNGFCSLPQTCTCYDGYKKTTHDLNKCEPICNNIICEYGNCIAPNECQCWKGYRINALKQICSPVCNEPCLNGFCSAPDHCTCLHGYIPNPDIDENPYECVPNCETCTNGNCSAPNQCDCFEGYSRFDNNDSCSPICTEDCVNGFCSSPEVCTCFDGYEMNETDSNHCQPVCENATCIYGDCLAPNNCQCWNGYEKNSDQFCSPVCSNSCINGYCSEPDICTCLDGYNPDSDDPFSCIPYCENCENGECTAPNECICFDGYEFDEMIAACAPQCNQSCINGFCSSTPDNCTCYEGYETSPNNSTFNCVPICERCQYGDCVEPGNCTCWKAYQWNEFSQTCELIQGKAGGNLTLSKQNAPTPTKQTYQNAVLWSSSIFLIVLIISTAAFISYFSKKKIEKRKREDSNHITVSYTNASKSQSIF